MSYILNLFILVLLLGSYSAFVNIVSVAYVLLVKCFIILPFKIFF